MIGFKYYLARGSKAQHMERSGVVGNFTLVTDAPELRFHDGVQLGGLVIPIPDSIYQRIKEVYETEGKIV